MTMNMIKYRTTSVSASGRLYKVVPGAWTLQIKQWMYIVKIFGRLGALCLAYSPSLGVGLSY